MTKALVHWDNSLNSDIVFLIHVYSLLNVEKLRSTAAMHTGIIDNILVTDTCLSALNDHT